MSKVKSLITADLQAQLKPVEQPNNFMAVLGNLAQPFMKPEAPTDPVERMRSKFAMNTDATLKAICDGAEKGKWFCKLSDGKFILSFRNANTVLTLNGSKQFQVADVDAATKLLQAAKLAAAAGELDDVLKATQRKPPVRKKREAEPA